MAARSQEETEPWHYYPRRYSHASARLGSVTTQVASDGNFYGTTLFGGMLGHGIIYRISSAGRFLVLHHFNKVNGSAPVALLQHTNGKLYGSTSAGGQYGDGVLFWFDWALKPFVKLETPSGPFGSHDWDHRQWLHFHPERHVQRCASCLLGRGGWLFAG
jgi:uncharacterized repeat protein (TIGR03803 family)